MQVPPAHRQVRAGVVHKGHVRISRLRGSSTMTIRGPPPGRTRSAELRSPSTRTNALGPQASHASHSLVAARARETDRHVGSTIASGVGDMPEGLIVRHGVTSGVVPRETPRGMRRLRCVRRGSRSTCQSDTASQLSSSAGDTRRRRFHVKPRPVGERVAGRSTTNAVPSIGQPPAVCAISGPTAPPLDYARIKWGTGLVARGGYLVACVSTAGEAPGLDG